jgi:hypothetical protein
VQPVAFTVAQAGDYWLDAACPVNERLDSFASRFDAEIDGDGDGFIDNPSGAPSGKLQRLAAGAADELEASRVRLAEPPLEWPSPSIARNVTRYLEHSDAQAAAIVAMVDLQSWDQAQSYEAFLPRGDERTRIKAADAIRAELALPPTGDGACDPWDGSDDWR